MLIFFILTALVLLNIILFNIYKNIAKRFSLIDKSMKFNNPITVTSSGIVIYLNLLFILILHFFVEDGLFKSLPNNFIFTIICFTILFIISTVDDLKPIDPKVRLFFQLVCVYFSITSIPIYQFVVPIKISIFICLCLWVYILNITNFTDGSDGFLATNTLFVFFNLFILGNIIDLNIFSSNLVPYLIPSLIIFIYYNKPNAKIYLGDSGSIQIGFINGFIFLELMMAGMLNIAASLLIYPILDCSLSLVKKTLQGKMPWVDTSNYSFLQPTIKNNKNKFFVFYLNIIFNVINSFLILIQFYYGWYLILLNILLGLIFITIYEKKK